MWGKTRWFVALSALGAVGLGAVGCSDTNEQPPPDGPKVATAGVRVGTPSGPTSEAGGQATFTVVLDARPRADVTVSYDSSDKTEGIVQPTQLVFTPDTWDTPQTVTVSGVDDSLRDRTQDYQVVFSATTSQDDLYAGKTPPPVALSNADDDTSGLLAKVTGETSEQGNQATLEVSLQSEPTAEVTVALRSSDPTEGTVGTPQLVFTPANWMAPQKVILTGVDDEEEDGRQVYMVELAASSTDADYAEAPARVEVVNLDDDMAGITASAVSGPTSEDGDKAVFTLTLSSRPVGAVVVDLVSSNPLEGTLPVASVTFTPETWKEPQTVTVQGMDDLIADGDQPFSVTFSSPRSQDPRYAALAAGTALLTNLDDDTAGILVTKPSADTSEMGAQATFTVALRSQPLANVTLNLDSDDKTEGTVTPKVLTFTPLDWKTKKKVTVKGVMDTIADGDVEYTIAFAAPVSTDPIYAALQPADVELTNLDMTGFCQPLSGIKCPTGVTAWCSPTPIFSTDAMQAKAACEACYGSSCKLSTIDCAGPAWGPGDDEDACGQPSFGYSGGCFGGQPGRVFPLCTSDSNLGRWAP